MQRTSKGVKGWGDEVEVTQLLNMLAPQLFISALHLESFHSRGQQLCKFVGTNGNCFTREKTSIPHATFLIFLYPNMAAVTSYENDLLFKYSLLPL